MPCLVRMRVNAGGPERGAPVVIPNQVAAHGRPSFGEKQRHRRQAAGIFNENLLDVMHREMMLVPGQPTALCIVEIPPVEVRQAMRND